MTQVETIALQRALVLLNSINVQYAIIDSDGQKYGTLELATPKVRQRAESEFPVGELRTYIRPFVENLEIGGMVDLPASKFKIEKVQSGVGSWFNQKNGKGSAITSINRDKNVVEVLRVF